MTSEEKREIEKRAADCYKLAHKCLEQGSKLDFRSCMGRITGIGEAVKIMNPDYRLVEMGSGNYKVVKESRVWFNSLKVIEMKENCYYN